VFDVHAWGPRTLAVLEDTPDACQHHIGPSFSPDGRIVLAESLGRWVKGFEVGSWRPYASYHAPPGRALASAAADLTRVVVTRADGSAPAVVTVANETEVALERPFAEESTYTISPDGLHVAGVSKGAMRLWSAKTGRIEYEEAP
jgi:hypothetical protein